MQSQFERTALLFGEDNIRRLCQKSVLLFGVGGVGSFVAEALARAGVGRIDLCDHDTISESNINRQLIALHSTVGKLKTDVMAARIADINPDAAVTTYPCFFGEDTLPQFDFSQYDYIIDAIDTVTAKLLIIETAKAQSIPIISSMGAGNKLDPTKFCVCDITKTSVCPLARVMRRELKARNISHLNVLFSPEEPITPSTPTAQNQSLRSTIGANDSANGAASRVEICADNSAMIDTITLAKSRANDGANACIAQPSAPSCAPRRAVPGSVPFVPSVAGLVIAGFVIQDMLK